MWLGSVASPVALLRSLFVYYQLTLVWAAKGGHCLCPASQDTRPIGVFAELVRFPNQLAFCTCNIL